MNVFVLLLAGHVLFGQPSVPPHGGRREIDKSDLSACCGKIKKERQRLYFLSDRNGKMRLQVRGVYVHGSVLLFLLQLNNRSSMEYAVGSIRFLPGGNDRNRTARSRSLEPIFISDSTKMVPGYSRAETIFVLPRFTMPAGGRLWIDVQERNGSRDLHIPITNWTLARARLI